MDSYSVPTVGVSPFTEFMYDTYTGHPEIKEVPVLEGFLLAGGDNPLVGVFGSVMENLLYCTIHLWSPNSPLSVGSLS
jgi:hypothetical protein